MKKLNEKGQILIFVALAFVILGTLAGLGIDLGRGYLERAYLSRVVDAAAIAGAMALQGQVGLHDEAILAACDAAEMNGRSCGGATDQGNFDLRIDFVSKPPEPGSPNVEFINVTGRASISTTLLSLLTLVSAGDFSTLNVSAFAEAGPQRPVDLMGVFDRSGSMNGTDSFGKKKIDALKRAVDSFLGNSFSPLDQIGMVSFSTRGCGNDGQDSNSPLDPCPPDIALGLADSSQIKAIQVEVQKFDAGGKTNTMEALRSAGKEIKAAFDNLDRQQSRKVILLVTDGQPTAMRRLEGQCESNPAGGPLPPPSPPSTGSPSFPNGCTFTLAGITPDPLIPVPLGMNRYTLQGEDPQATFTSSTLYQDVARSTRDMVVGAMFEADKIRDYKSQGSTSGKGEVVIYVIGIGKAVDPDFNKGQLDANAKCLLARIANANIIDNPGSVDETLLSTCSDVKATADGDPYDDIKCSALPCTINSNQQEGRVWTVDSNNDVEGQLKVIFDKIVALLKLRLTI